MGSYEDGMKVRRLVLGDAHVDRALAATTDLDVGFQRWITERVWGDVWSGEGIDLRTRSIVTIAILGALNHEELELHLRAAQNTGVTQEEIAEVSFMSPCTPASPPPTGHSEWLRPSTRRTSGHDRPRDQALRPKAYADHPPFLYPDYKSTVLRSPTHDLIQIVQTLTETTGPGPVWSEVSEEDADLTTNAGTGGSAIGERIIVTGRVLDEAGNGVPGVLLELWQANSSGRYVHWRETAFPAPLDPNFIGVGQCRTNEAG